ncbi:MAG: nucleoside deaminase, partial [bacterium]
MKCNSEKKTYSIKSHEYFLSKALMLAQRNIENTIGGPFGALIVKNESIISTGVNSVIPIIDPTAHAEIVAIRQACADLKTIDLSDCTLYTSCEPCPMCLA